METKQKFDEIAAHIADGTYQASCALAMDNKPFWEDLRQYAMMKCQFNDAQAQRLVMKAAVMCCDIGQARNFETMLLKVDELTDFILDLSKETITRDMEFRPILEYQEHASCNSCGRSNYQSSIPACKMPPPAFENLYQLVIGHMAIRLCPDCLRYLVDKGNEILEEGDAFFYGQQTRFSYEALLKAKKRLKADTMEQAIRIVKNFDKGHGDIDDVIDAYESDTGY